MSNTSSSTESLDTNPPSSEEEGEPIYTMEDDGCGDDQSNRTPKNISCTMEGPRVVIAWRMEYILGDRSCVCVNMVGLY